MTSPYVSLLLSTQICHLYLQHHKQWGSRRVWGEEGSQHHLVRMGMLAGLMTKAALKNPS